jgi:hypothetical protein
MKKNILRGLFFVSLAFNVAFIGLFIHHQVIMRRIPPFAPPMEHFHRHPFFERNNEEIRELRHSFLQQKRFFLEQVRRNELTIPELEHELNILLEKQILMEEHIGKFMIEMRQKLTNEQVDCFLDRRLNNQRLEKKEINLKNRRKK